MQPRKPLCWRRLARLATEIESRVDLRTRRVDALVPEEEWQRRDPSAWGRDASERYAVAGFISSACSANFIPALAFDMACAFRDVCRVVPRHNH